jgi:hypothetical protein
MRGHKGPVKAYVQRDREGSTHIYSYSFSLWSTYYRNMLHLQSPLHASFIVPRKETSPPGSPHGAPTYRKTFYLQSPLYLSVRFPRRRAPSRQVPLTESLEKKPLRQFPLMEPNRERRSIPRAVFYLSLEVPGERAPSPTYKSPIGAPMKRDARHHSLLYISF